MMLPPTKRPRWKIGKGKKLPRDRNKGSNGIRDYSEESVADLVDQKKAKRILTGYLMQKCLLSQWPPQILNKSADCTSDGPSPEIKVKQILAVYPILKGQSASDPLHTTPSQHKQPQRNPAEQEDLIDFGRPDEKPAPSSGLPQNKNIAQDNPVEPSSLQQPLQPDVQPSLVRVDTETNEVDQFVDAKP